MIQVTIQYLNNTFETSRQIINVQTTSTSEAYKTAVSIANGRQARFFMNDETIPYTEKYHQAYKATKSDKRTINAYKSLTRDNKSQSKETTFNQIIKLTHNCKFNLSLTYFDKNQKQSIYARP